MEQRRVCELVCVLAPSFSRERSARREGGANDEARTGHGAGRGRRRRGPYCIADGRCGFPMRWSLYPQPQAHTRLPLPLCAAAPLATRANKRKLAGQGWAIWGLRLRAARIGASEGGEHHQIQGARASTRSPAAAGCGVLDSSMHPAPWGRPPSGQLHDRGPRTAILIPKGAGRIDAKNWSSQATAPHKPHRMTMIARRWHHTSIPVPALIPFPPPRQKQTPQADSSGSHVVRRRRAAGAERGGEPRGGHVEGEEAHQVPAGSQGVSIAVWSGLGLGWG